MRLANKKVEIVAGGGTGLGAALARLWGEGRALVSKYALMRRQ
jgi:NAD(P)-dependent dehydrogenase (short-subunit alcohol dehydrogenase family)